MEVTKIDDDEEIAERLILERNKEAVRNYYDNLGIGTIPISELLDQIESLQRRRHALEETIARIFDKEDSTRGLEDVGTSESLSVMTEEFCSDSMDVGARKAIGEPSLSAEATGAKESASDENVHRSEEDLRKLSIENEEK